MTKRSLNKINEMIKVAVEEQLQENNHKNMAVTVTGMVAVGAASFINTKRIVKKELGNAGELAQKVEVQTTLLDQLLDTLYPDRKTKEEEEDNKEQK